jgi:hypothetical protein
MLYLFSDYFSNITFIVLAVFSLFVSIGYAFTISLIIAGLSKVTNKIIVVLGIDYFALMFPIGMIMLIFLRNNLLCIHLFFVMAGLVLVCLIFLFYRYGFPRSVPSSEIDELNAETDKK